LFDDIPPRGISREDWAVINGLEPIGIDTESNAKELKISKIILT
jgi:hypothetical protein